MKHIISYSTYNLVDLGLLIACQNKYVYTKNTKKLVAVEIRKTSNWEDLFKLHG